MSNPLVIQVGMARTASFRTESEAARQDMEKLNGAVNRTSAELVSLQRAARLPGGATEEMNAGIQKTRQELKGLKADLQTAKSEYKALNEAAAAPSLPRDANGRPVNQWRQAAEQQRAAHDRKAVQDALDAKLAKDALPAASRPMAEITQAGGADGKGGKGGGGLSRNSRMQLMGAGHHAANSMLNGVNPMDALMVQAPDIIEGLAMSNLGGAVLGMAAPVAIAAAGGLFIKFLRDSNEEAKKLREETAQIGSNLGSLSGANAESLGKSLGEASENVRKVREANDAKGNQFANLFGHGVHDSDVRGAVDQQQRIQDHMQDAQGRDQGFARRAFEGDDGVEAEKAMVDYAQKRDEIIKKTAADNLTSSTRALELARQERDLKLEELARRQQMRRNEIAEETQIASIDRYGKNVESEHARAHLERARADLAAGPKEGPEFEASQAKVWTAENAHEDATRREKGAQATLALEEKIVGIKRDGHEVDVRIAEERLATAQKLLDGAKPQGDEHDRLQASVNAARFEVEQSKKATLEKQSQLQLETQIANLRGSSDQVHRRTLALEAAHLRELIHSDQTTPDERRAYKKSLRQNRQQQDEGKKTDDLRAIDREGTLDQALTGRGPEAERAHLEREMGRDRRRLDWNKNENGNDEGTAVQIVAHYAGLKKSLEDLNEREKERLTTLKQQTTEIQQQGYEKTLPQKQQGIKAHYQTQIDQANFQDDRPLAAALTQQRDAAMHNAAVDEEMMTPGQRARRNRENLRRRQAEERVDARARHGQVPDHSMSGSFDDYFHGSGRHTIGGHPNRRPGTDQPNRRPEVNVASAAHADAARNGFKGSLATVESLLSEIKQEVSYQEK